MASKKKSAKKMGPAATADWVLEGMHRVLKYRDVTDRVKVRIAGTDYCWVCRVDASGTEVCGWEKC